MKKILILDDDKDNLEILSFILTEYSYQIKAVSSGYAIFDEINAWQPDLILMDVMLAGLDGREICRAIKENQSTAHVPVILISGTHDLADSLHLPGAPDDYIAKPYDLDQLLIRVKAQL